MQVRLVTNVYGIYIIKNMFHTMSFPILSRQIDSQYRIWKTQFEKKLGHSQGTVNGGVVSK